MGIFNILFGVKRAEIGGIVLDASIRELHENSAVVTENPVENGLDITDHVHVKPKALTIEGIITDTPVTFSVVNAVTGLIETVSSFFGKKSRSMEGYEALLKLMESREPFTVVTGLKRYTNMVIESLSVPRDSERANAIYFTARMREVRIVQSRTTSTSLNDDVADIGSETSDIGKQVSNEVPVSDPLLSLTSELRATFQDFGSLRSVS